MNSFGLATHHFLAWALVVGLASVIILWIRSRKNSPQAGSAVSNKKLISICRILLLFFLGLALSQPYRENVDQSTQALVLVDVSDSMEAAVASELWQKVSQFAAEGLELSILPFAKKTNNFSSSFDRNMTYETLSGSSGRLDVGATDVAQALRQAVSEISSAQSANGNIVLLSDGQETEGDALRMQQMGSLSEVKIFPLIPLDSGPPSQSFRISQLYAPLVAPVQKSVDVRVSLQNTTNQPQTGILEVMHDQHLILSKRVSIDPGGSAGRELLVVAQSDPGVEGLKEITATLKPDNRSLNSSSETIFLSGETRERVLLINGSAEDEHYLAEVLKGQSYQLKSLLSDWKFESLPAFSDYSLVIFNNVALGQLPSASLTNLDTYVRGGGSFLMIGGNKSFGLGGYLHSSMENLLPLQMLPPQTVEKRLNVAVQLVLDKSSSMAYDNKIEFAKEGAREVIRNLKDEDYVGVIGFDSAPWIVVKLERLDTNRDQALERVGRLFAAQRTNLMPAIEEAQRGLTRVNAGRKHIIILTDGRIPDGGPYYIEMVKQLRLQGISVSTILVGAEAQGDLLQEMADYGGGAFYQTMDARTLPRIFLNDIKVAGGEKTLKENQEYVVRYGPDELKSTSIQSFPPLRGYVQTKAKDGAQLELVAYANERAEPLLARWQVGKGKSVAFTSDANGRWSNNWVRWTRFAQFWSDVIDSVRPKDKETAAIKFDLRYQVEHSALTLDVSVFSELSDGALRAQVGLPDGGSKEVEFNKISTGRYKAELEHVTAGKYEVRLQNGAKKLTPVAFKLSGDLFGEKRSQGFNLPLLQTLAFKSGGKINPTADELKQQMTSKVTRTSYSWLCLLLASIFFLLEVLAREVPGVFRLRFKIRRSV